MAVKLQNPGYIYSFNLTPHKIRHRQNSSRRCLILFCSFCYLPLGGRRSSHCAVIILIKHCLYHIHDSAGCPAHMYSCFAFEFCSVSKGIQQRFVQFANCIKIACDIGIQAIPAMLYALHQSTQANVMELEAVGFIFCKPLRAEAIIKMFQQNQQSQLSQQRQQSQLNLLNLLSQQSVQMIFLQ